MSRPGLPINDELCGRVADAKLVGKALDCATGRPQGADALSGLHGQDTAPVALSDVGLPVSDFISLVLGACAPTKIVRAIVPLLSVEVPHLMSRRRLRAMKGLCNQNVGKRFDLLTVLDDRNRCVSIRAEEAQSLQRIVWRSLAFNAAIDVAVVAREVASKARNGFQIGHPPMSNTVTAFLKCLLLSTLLAGCSKTVIVQADALCKDWEHQSVSKNDKLTQGTAEIADGNNHRRETWGCAYGQNVATLTK